MRDFSARRHPRMSLSALRGREWKWRSRCRLSKKSPITNSDPQPSCSPCPNRPPRSKALLRTLPIPTPEPNKHPILESRDAPPHKHETCKNQCSLANFSNKKPTINMYQPKQNRKEKKKKKEKGKRATPAPVQDRKKKKKNFRLREQQMSVCLRVRACVSWERSIVCDARKKNKMVRNSKARAPGEGEKRKKEIEAENGKALEFCACLRCSCRFVVVEIIVSVMS